MHRTAIFIINWRSIVLKGRKGASRSIFIKKTAISVRFYNKILFLIKTDQNALFRPFL